MVKSSWATKHTSLLWRLSTRLWNQAERIGLHTSISKVGWSRIMIRSQLIKINHKKTEKKSTPKARVSTYFWPHNYTYICIYTFTEGKLDYHSVTAVHFPCLVLVYQPYIFQPWDLPWITKLQACVSGRLFCYSTVTALPFEDTFITSGTTQDNLLLNFSLKLVLISDSPDRVWCRGR